MPSDLHLNIYTLRMKVGLIQPPLPSLFPLNQSFRLATDRCHKLRDPNKSFRFFCLHSWEYGSQQTHHDHILLCCALCSVQGVVGGRRCPCIISTGGRPNFLLKYLGIYHKNKVSFLSLIEYFCLPMNASVTSFYVWNSLSNFIGVQ